MALSDDLSGLALFACDLASIDCSMMGLPWTGALLLSTLWIIYRVYLVLQKPVEELDEVLGNDVPPVPDISLSSITSTSILLYWKPPENYHSPARQSIQINGITIDEFEQSDGSVQLTGLQPGFYYGIRAIVTNSTGNSTYSKLIQVQTVPEDGNRGIRLLSNAESNVKRTVSGRRVSQPIASYDQVPTHSSREISDSNEPDSDETITRLTKKLDTLRRQKEGFETQLAEEIEDSDKQRSLLTTERDDLKRVVEDRDKASADQRRHIGELEKQSKATQRRRQAKEKILQQKRAERQRMRDDIAKWQNEVEEMEEKAESLRAQKSEIVEAHMKKMEQTREVIETVQAESKLLEEEIREWGIKIKHLEDHRKNADKAQTEEEQEAERRDREEDQAHESRVNDMHNQYTVLWKLIQDGETQLQHEQDYLSSLLELRSKDPSKFGNAPSFDYSLLHTAQRRSRHGSNRLSSSTYSSNTYSPPPGFNSNSGMPGSIPPTSFSPFSPPSRVGTGFSNLSQKDVDHYSVGAPMSPTANNLLPSDLLGDDEPPRSRGGAGSRLALDTFGYRPAGFDANNGDPQSPLSVHSASPSVLSSPHESFANVSAFPADADRQSLRSTGSPYNQTIAATSGPGSDRRRTSLFHFSRQRPKSSINDPPALGTLKASQSQSFPSNEQEPVAPGMGRRKLGSNIWSSPVASFLTRGASTAIENDAGPAPLPGKTRRRLFGSKLDPTEALAPLDRSSSPRPSSTYSYDHILPRPSSDSQPFGWPTQDGLRQRSSPHGSTWAPMSSNLSRNPSRRQSIQHGSTSNLSLGSTPLEPDEFQASLNVNKPPQPAPIGTERFTISKEKAKEKERARPKQLNPAAPTFNMRLFNKKTPKADKADADSEKSKSKSKEKDKDKDRTQTPSRSSAGDDLLSSPEDSHSSPRLSRDTPSISASAWDEFASTHDFLEPTVSGSHSDHQASTPSSSAPKESLMQRISRKSSSSKFSAAWSARGSLFSSSKKSVGEPSTPGDVDEEAEGGDYLGVKGLGGATSDAGTSVEKGEREKDREREKSGRPSLSWSRVMSKKGKSKGGDSRVSSEVERADDEE